MIRQAHLLCFVAGQASALAAAAGAWLIMHPLIVNSHAAPPSIKIFTEASTARPQEFRAPASAIFNTDPALRDRLARLEAERDSLSGDYLRLALKRAVDSSLSRAGEIVSNKERRAAPGEMAEHFRDRELPLVGKDKIHSVRDQFMERFEGDDTPSPGPRVRLTVGGISGRVNELGSALDSLRALGSMFVRPDSPGDNAAGFSRLQEVIESVEEAREEFGDNAIVEHLMDRARDGEIGGEWRGLRLLLMAAMLGAAEERGES